MKSLIRLAEEFENYTGYIENISQLLKSIQSIFPNVKLRPFDEFASFLDRYLPAIIRKYLVGTRSVKNCSGISPDFAEFAAKHGFAVLIENVPGHMRNVFLSENSGYMVDLSYIQFKCGYNDDVIVDTLKEIYKDPQKAIKIQKLPATYFGNFTTPHGRYDNLYDPSKSIELYDEDKEGQEEDFQTLEKWNNVLKKKRKDEEINNINSNLERQTKTPSSL